MRYVNFLVSILLLSFFITISAFAYSGDDPSEDGVVKENTPIFHIYDDIDLISTQKIIYGKPKVVVKAVYPRLESDVNRDPIDKFNQTVLNTIQEEADKFQKNAKEMQKNLHNPPKSGKNDLFIDYDSSVIKSGRYHIISIRMSIEGMIMGAAHPFHYHRVLNYNLDTGETIELADLFQEDADYLHTLSNYTKKTLTRRLDNKEMIAEGTAPTVANFRVWNIKPTGILITFDEYQVAPYVFGAQTVLVPYFVLKSILSNASPITKCMRQGRCLRNNVLTGGFIEEAINVIDQPPVELNKHQL